MSIRPRAIAIAAIPPWVLLGGSVKFGTTPGGGVETGIWASCAGVKLFIDIFEDNHGHAKAVKSVVKEAIRTD